MSIKSRLPKIREAAKQTVLCLNKSPFESIYSLRSLSDPATNYQVRLRWDSGKSIPFVRIFCECHQVAGVGGIQPDCKGNMNGTVCYHSLASLIRKAEDKGQSLFLFDNFDDATAINFGGKLVKVVSAQGSGCCWAVVSQRKQSDLPGDGGLDKINFELSPEEKRKLDQEMKQREIEAENIKELSRGRLISLEEKIARQEKVQRRRQYRMEMMRGPREKGID